MSITAKTILATTAGNAGQLVPGTSDPRKALLQLAAKWHPDRCSDPDAGDVFRHLLDLRDTYDVSGQASGGAERIFDMADGRRLRTIPLSIRDCDQGEILVGVTSLVTIYAADLSELALRQAGIRSEFVFSDKNMERQMAPFLPARFQISSLSDGRVMVMTSRRPAEILLADLLDRHGSMPSVHAAWLCSGLLNIAAWLTYTSLVHGAIGPDAVLIDPEKHSVRLATGWGFATRIGDRPTALPARTVDLMPRLARPGQTASPSIDLELIRQTIRESLGDPHGTSGTIFDLPEPIASWLNFPAPKDAISDYSAWQEALLAGWGKRRFVNYRAKASDIYSA